MTDKVGPLVTALMGTTPARIRLRGVIKTAIEAWTNHLIQDDSPVPVIRDGHVRNHGMLSAWPSVSSMADELVRAAGLENRIQLQTRYDRLSSCRDAIRLTMQAFSDLKPVERSYPSITSTFPWGKTTERRVIDGLGVWLALPASCESAIEMLEEQIKQIEEAISQFEITRGRPRDEAAHQVAISLGRIFATVTGRKPTYSEDADGLHGDFTPLLRNVFNALGWNRTLRGPAEAAVNSISESYLQELNRPQFNGLGSLFSTVS